MDISSTDRLFVNPGETHSPVDCGYVTIPEVAPLGATQALEITNIMENESHTGIILWIIIGIAILAACGLLTALMVFLGFLILA